MVTIAPLPVSDFLLAREHYKLAIAKHDNQERRLFELFGVSNAADLEEAIMAGRSQGLKHAEEVLKFSELEHALDRAGNAYDLACERQRRKIEEQRGQLDRDFARVEC